MHKSIPGETGLILCSLYILIFEFVRLLQPCLDFLLYGKGNFQGNGCDQLRQHLVHRFLNVGAGNALTNRFAVLNALTLTDIARYEVILATMVATQSRF